MLYSEIDLSGEVVKPRLFLCRNDLNRTVIANLNEVYGINQKISIGNISELSFQIPIEIDVRQKAVRNPAADHLKERYLVRFEKGAQIEYYIIHKISSVMEDSADYKRVELFSLPYELRSKLIRDYKATSYRPSQLLNDMLKETIYTVGYIDSEFELKFRSFEFTGNVLEALTQIAETFQAVLEYDTVARTISLKRLESIGVNRGLKVSYGNLLRSVTYESDSSEFCTRLKVFGKDGLSIQKVNPTGANFIEDYSSVLYPFQRDESGHVLFHSDYISDDLCHALLDYQQVVESKRGLFTQYLGELGTLNTSRTAEKNTLAALETEFREIEDQLSLANANANETSAGVLIGQKEEKNIEVAAQTAVLSGIEAQIAAKQTQIDGIKQSLALELHFTADQLREWNPHIVMGEWTESNLADEQQLYEAAKEEFAKLREPKIVVTISVVNFLELIEEQHNWDKLRLGDTITIRYDKLRIHVEAKIIEAAFDYESGDIQLTVSNVRELLTDKDRFIRSLYKSISTSTTFTSDKYKYDDAYLKSTEVYADIHNTWEAAKREITASNNETVEIGRKGIITRDLNDPDRYVVMQHGLIALTQDDGNTWKTVITPERIVAEQIKGVMLAGTELEIVNQAGTVSLDEKGFIVTDMDLTLKTEDNANQIIMNPDSGFKMQKNTGTSDVPVWKDRISLVDGDVNVTGKIVGSEITGGTITIGSGNDVFKVNENGVYIGHSAYGSAPFRVDYQGNATMNKLTANTAQINDSQYNGGAIVGSSINVGNGKFTVDSDGTVVAKDGTFRGIIQAEGGYFSGNITAYGTISGGKIVGAEFKGGKIDVSTDVYVGNNIYLNDPANEGEEKSIIFYNRGNLTFGSDGTTLAAFNHLNLSSSLVTYNNQEIATKNWALANVVARFA
jgi:phage minor structural protein